MVTSHKEKILKAFGEVGGDPSDEAACLEWLSSLPFDNPDLHQKLLGGNYASLDDKLDKLSLHHCTICKASSPYPIKRIPLNIPPISKQAASGDKTKHFETSIKAYLKSIRQEDNSYPKGERLCVFVIFLLGKNDRDKDLDNMSKALLDALKKCLFHDDDAIDHLNLIKLRDNVHTGHGEIFVNIRKSDLRTNSDVVFDARNYRKRESIA